MSTATRILQGEFGRVALLNMDCPLVAHAHSETHVLLKVSGEDTWFGVRDTLQPLTDDTAVLVNAWEPHFYDHRPNAAETLILAMYIHPAWLETLESGLSTSSHPKFFPRPCVDISRRIRSLVDAFVADMLYRVVLDGSSVEERIFELMIAVVEPFSDWRSLEHAPRFRGIETDARINRAITRMRQSPASRWDMDSLAHAANLSRSHFFERFRRTTNLTPGIFLNVLRMEMAFDRITHTESSMADISNDLQFSAQTHFCRFFRRHQGIPPSEYRRTADVFQPPATGIHAGSTEGRLKKSDSLVNRRNHG